MCRHRHGIRGMGLSPGFWLRAWILVALGDKELHGYELMSKVCEVFPGLIAPGPSGMGRGYRILRMLEMEGLITSKWSTEEAGPAKRVYKLTPEGEIARKEIIDYAEEMRDYFDEFLKYPKGKEE
jgi:DNA-binding PadR family transcriptional regulator